jgi:hypothetical protein
MLTLKKSTLPATEAELREALAEHVAASEAHRFTVGVPAPWPRFDVVREIIADGGEFNVEDDLPPPPTERELALRALAEHNAAKDAAERAARADLALACAALAPDAPQAVKDYAATLPQEVKDQAAEQVADAQAKGPLNL